MNTRDHTDHRVKRRPTRPPTVLAAVVALAVVLAACGSSSSSSSAGHNAHGTTAASSSFPVTVTAANGKVKVAKKPTQIVSLSPTATEMLYAIGAGLQVKAVDNDSDYPQ